VAVSNTVGEIDFYVDEKSTVWGTTNLAWVERNRSLGAGQIKKIKVPSLLLSEIALKFGTPRYCKIDIEGNDLEAVQSFAGSRSLPKFLSIESEKQSWTRLLQEFRLFEELGYRKYKIVDQSLITFQRSPTVALEGDFVDHKFEWDSSGLFGDELPGPWLTVVEALEVYKGIFRGYALNGDFGLFVGSKKSAFSALAFLQTKFHRAIGSKAFQNPATILPPAGWYDTHAALL
jgi:hypothetical protein